MNNYNYNKNKILIILIMKFEEYNYQYIYKWEINYYIYSKKNSWWVILLSGINITITSRVLRSLK